MSIPAKALPPAPHPPSPSTQHHLTYTLLVCACVLLGNELSGISGAGRVRSALIVQRQAEASERSHRFATLSSPIRQSTSLLPLRNSPFRLSKTQDQATSPDSITSAPPRSIISRLFPLPASSHLASFYAAKALTAAAPCRACSQRLPACANTKVYTNYYWPHWKLSLGC